MFGRKKKEKATEGQPTVQINTTPQPPQASQSSSGFELQVFDGKGHPAVMIFTRDANGNVVQRLKKGRDFKAHLKHIKH